VRAQAAAATGRRAPYGWDDLLGIWGEARGGVVDYGVGCLTAPRANGGRRSNVTNIPAVKDVAAHASAYLGAASIGALNGSTKHLGTLA